MKRLFLLRHAKAAPAAREADDHARALTERGRADAVLMSGYIRQKNYRPDRVLCSDAARTRETLQIGREFTDLRPYVDYRADLYLAEAAALLSIIRDVPAQTKSVMLVGHNPGLEQLSAALLNLDSKKPRNPYDALEEKFPTAALAVLDFDVPRWEQLAEGSGKLADFKTPKDLKT